MAKPIINWESILLKSKRASIPKVEEVLFDVITDGAEQFVDILTQEMGSSNVPESVIQTAASLTPGEPELYAFLSHKTGWYKKGRAEITLTFGDDPTRESFGSSGPVNNIVDLFNNGYTISGNKLPAGEWHGSKWVARKSRPKLGFMESARRRAKREVEGLRDAVAQ